MQRAPGPFVRVQGRIVETLLDRHLEPGSYTYAWSEGGSRESLAAGVYFLSVRTAGAVATRKLVIVR